MHSGPAPMEKLVDVPRKRMSRQNIAAWLYKKDFHVTSFLLNETGY